MGRRGIRESKRGTFAYIKAAFENRARIAQTAIAGSARSYPQGQADRADSFRRFARTPGATSFRTRRMSKKSTASERTEKQLDVFIDPAPEAGPLKLRPFS